MSADRAGRWLAIAATVVVVATVATAVLVMGGPSQQRLVRLDERRIADLGRIEGLVADHVERTGVLPPDLAALARQPGIALDVSDPVDGAGYGYEPLGELRYRLCADFATDTAQQRGARQWGDQWNHGAGRHCFERRATRASAPEPLPRTPG